MFFLKWKVVNIDGNFQIYWLLAQNEQGDRVSLSLGLMIKEAYLVRLTKKIKPRGKEVFILLDFLSSSFPFLPLQCISLLFIMTADKKQSVICAEMEIIPTEDFK